MELTLGLVRLSSEHGGWNNHIYLTARQFFDVGMSVEEAMGLLMEAAAPWNDAEAHVVSRTVNSAWNGHMSGDSSPHWSYRRQL